MTWNHKTAMKDILEVYHGHISGNLQAASIDGWVSTLGVSLELTVL